MKSIFSLLVALTCMFSISFAQETILTDADRMAKALIESDYNTFLNYTYPKILKDMGGRKKMQETIKKQMDDLSLQGVKILSITYGEPNVIIKEKDELQTTLLQEMTFDTKEGKIQTKSSIIAISTNNGNSWYFVDPGERDLETVRLSLPNLSKKLVLPPHDAIKVEK